MSSLFTANVIAQVYEVLKSQQSDVVGIFTAKKNTKVKLFIYIFPITLYICILTLRLRKAEFE